MKSIEILAVIVIFLFINIYQCTPENCPEGFTKLSTGCYHFSENNTNWFGALQKCAAMEASLLSIETVEESIVIKLHLHYHQSNNAFYWTSGTDAHQEGQFKWMSTLEAVNYTDWCFSEPNNYAGIHHCILLVHYKNNAVCWGDHTCYVDKGDHNIPIYYICELKPKIPCECK